MKIITRLLDLNPKNIFLFYLIFCGISIFIFSLFLIQGDPRNPNDFESYYSAGKNLFQKNITIYDNNSSRDNPLQLPEPMRIFNPLRDQISETLGVKSEIFDPGFIFPNIYPPPFAYFMKLWTWLGLEAAFRAWLLLLLTLYLSFPVLSYLLMKEVESRESRFFSISVLTFSLTFVVLDNFYWGQVNILVTFFVLSSLVLTSINRSLLSALFLTLAIFTKITPAFYLFFFLYQKKYREIVYIGFFSLSIFLLTYFSGKENWFMFLQIIRDVGNTQTIIRGLMPSDIFGNLSLNGLVARILPFSFSYKQEILYFLNSSLITICAYQAYMNRQKPKTGIFFLQLTIISILITPMAWFHHFIALYPAGIFLFRETFRKNIFKERKFLFSTYFICLMPLSRITNLLVSQLQTGWFLPSLLNSFHTLMILLLFVLTIFDGRKLENLEGEKSPSGEN